MFYESSVLEGRANGLAYRRGAAGEASGGAGVTRM